MGQGGGGYVFGGEGKDGDTQGEGYINPGHLAQLNQELWISDNEKNTFRPPEELQPIPKGALCNWEVTLLLRMPLLPPSSPG